MLWVGLGNPGTAYAANRHNVGFMALDIIAGQPGFSSWRRKSSAALCEGLIDNKKVRLLKPLTFMNRSGLPVRESAAYFNLLPEQIIVFHDDIDLGAGRMRVKQGGGHGGHNGLRDIDRHLGRNYWRVRIGVGRPAHNGDVDKWVLSDFSKHEHTHWLDMLLDALTAEAPRLASGDMAGFASKVAWRAPAPQTQNDIQNGDTDGI